MIKHTPVLLLSQISIRFFKTIFFISFFFFFFPHFLFLQNRISLVWKMFMEMMFVYIIQLPVGTPILQPPKFVKYFLIQSLRKRKKKKKKKKKRKKKKNNLRNLKKLILEKKSIRVFSYLKKYIKNYF